MRLSPSRLLPHPSPSLVGDAFFWFFLYVSNEISMQPKNVEADHCDTKMNPARRNRSQPHSTDAVIGAPACHFAAYAFCANFVPKVVMPVSLVAVLDELSCIIMIMVPIYHYIIRSCSCVLSLANGMFVCCARGWRGRPAADPLRAVTCTFAFQIRGCCSLLFVSSRPTLHCNTRMHAAAE